MAVTYKKLFHLLIDKGMTNAELMEKAGFSANIITRIKRDNYISLDTIEKICKTLDCGVDDILEFTTEIEGRCYHRQGYEPYRQKLSGSRSLHRNAFPRTRCPFHRREQRCGQRQSAGQRLYSVLEYHQRVLCQGQQ